MNEAVAIAPARARERMNRGKLKRRWKDLQVDA